MSETRSETHTKHTNVANSPKGRTMSSPEFLRETLEANLRFQANVREELHRIAERKAENRRQAARLLQHVVATWDQNDNVTQQQQQTQLVTGTNGSNSSSNEAKWKFDPYRRWTRRYFVDPQGSVPPPNPEVLRRRQLEHEQHALCHTNASPWTTKETKILQGIVQNIMTNGTAAKAAEPTRTAESDAPSTTERTHHEAVAITTLDDVDFEEVATLLRDATRSGKERKSMLQPRSADDCRLQYQHSQGVIPFSKQESLAILEQVHADEHKQPNWRMVAASLSANNNDQQPRTAWQCLCQYQTKLVSTPSEPWTVQEDELLFWYLAAMGPQFLLDTSSAAHLSSRLFPNKAPKQILPRANQTLLNPNLRHQNNWSDEDQRKLVLCMKIYSDSSTAASALTRAAAHFPNRASKSVAEKWNRSLNPEFTTRSFTPEEDQALLDAVRSNTPWSDIARQFHRFQIQRLYRRWEVLATDDDLAQYAKDAMKRKEGAKRGLVGSGEDALLDPEDFVLQVKKKRKQAPR